MTKILSTSLPKSGTHLFEGVFSDLGFTTKPAPKNNGAPALRSMLEAEDQSQKLYWYGHWRAYGDVAGIVRESGFKILVVLRDPRDVCLSMAEFIRMGQPAALRAAAPELMHMPLKDVVARVIVGKRYPAHNLPSMRAFCDGWMQWRDHGAVFVRYEDVAALAASADDAAAAARFADIAQLGVDVDEFVAAAKARFGKRKSDGSGTLNVGRAGRWTSVFDDELVALWNASSEGVATLLGYEECRPGSA